MLADDATSWQRTGATDRMGASTVEQRYGEYIPESTLVKNIVNEFTLLVKMTCFLSVHE